MDVLNDRKISDLCLELKHNSSVIQPMEVTMPTELSYLLHRPEEMEVAEKPYFQFYLSMYCTYSLTSTTPLPKSPLGRLHCGAQRSHMAFQVRGITELKDKAQ